MDPAAQAPVAPPAPVYPPDWERPPAPDISHLVTEDDTPVDSIFSERQMRLLARSLYASWRPSGDRPFVAMTNVGLFSSPQRPPVVPDVLVSLDVSAPTDDPHRKEHRSYFVWEYGKAPEVIVEIVSNREGGEAERKRAEYARIGVRYYVIFDPEHHLQAEDLRAFVLHGSGYQPLASARLGETGLGLVLWRGRFEDLEETWLRWTDERGTMIPTGEERADAEHARADAAEAENARLRACLRDLEEGRPRTD